MTAVFLRELSSYFISPVGYVYLAAFYLLAGYQFTVTLLGGSADLTSEFTFLYTVVLLLTPILTMRLMSEDRKQKTDQILFSAPVTLTGIVAGKYFAAVAVYLMGVAVTLLHAAVLTPFADVSWAIVIGNVVGLALLGMAADRPVYVYLGADGESDHCGDWRLCFDSCDSVPEFDCQRGFFCSAEATAHQYFFLFQIL